MTLIAKPNAWVAVDDAATKLTYAPAVNPAPLTTSVPKRAPTLGSLVVAITNNTEEDLVVARVTFLVVIGKPGPEGAPLMAGLPASIGVSDADSWEFLGPPAKFSEGLAEYVLKPKAGMGTLKVGESVLVELVDFPTVEGAGSSIVKVSEDVGGKELETRFSVPTFPGGFFFDSLVATVVEGSAHVPVAQVERGSKVVLLWSSSVSVDDQKVRYSNAAEGQKVEQPHEPGRWESPPLTTDTVFSVCVEATGADEESLPATLTTSVAVKDPALVANSVQTGEMSANSATITGALSATTGPISLFSKFREPIPEGTYEAPTDGLALCLVRFVPEQQGVAEAFGWASQLVFMHANAGGTVMSNSFVLPIVAGSRFALGTMGVPPGETVYFWWCPFGKGKLKRVGGATPPPGALEAPPATAPKPGAERAIDLLAPHLATPLDAETRAQLIAALQGQAG
jgi:hypothetical protein